MVSNRGRGVLTESDRKFLAASERERKEEYSSAARTKRRQAIRERVTNAMYDFAILYEGLPDEELREIFSQEVKELDEDEELSEEDAEMMPAAMFPRVIAFLARVSDLDGDPIFPGMDRHQPALEGLFSTIDRGLETWLAKDKRVLANVVTEFNTVNADPIDTVIRKIRAGEEVRILSERERQLLRSEGLSEDLIADLREEQQEHLDEYGSGVFDPLPTDNTDEE
jgi:hypothetical protein